MDLDGLAVSQGRGSKLPQPKVKPRNANSKAEPSKSRDRRSGERNLRRNGTAKQRKQQTREGKLLLRPEVDHDATHEAHTKRKPWILVLQELQFVKPVVVRRSISRRSTTTRTGRTRKQLA